jgi:GT2 family glycosyltransferase
MFGQWFVDRQEYRVGLMKQKAPFFSIIVPTYNRPAQLGLCLTSLSRLEYERDRFEVIVVDDGSKMPLDPVIAPFNGMLDVTLVSQHNRGPATARNNGAAMAKGQFLAFTDDDCAPASSWLRRLATRFEKSPDHVIGGKTVNGLPGNMYSTVTQMIVDYLIDHSGATRNQRRFFPSNNFAVPADAFNAVGGFDTDFPLGAGEDRELSQRLVDHDYLLVYAPEAIVYHLHSFTLSTFLRRHFDYGRGSFQFHQTRARQSNQRILLEPKLFYLNLLLHPFSRETGFTTIRFGALVALSQLANAAGFFWKRHHRNRKGFS